MPAPHFRKFLWIELIGFDNREKDFGVAEFLSRMPIKPEVISILIWNTDLIHSHHGLETDAPIGLKHCAYQARPRNEEHDIQNWTRFQLRGLISELHHHGVKVYVSFFDQLMAKETQRRIGLPDTDEWIDHHQEVRYIDCLGRKTSLCIWKRLADGSLYEDFFIRQLETFLRDYGFDGLHGADGYGHPRENIANADFSDDMVGQFTDCTGIHCPPNLDLPDRAQWILDNVRAEWTTFHAKRHAQFWRKMIAMLNRNGWEHALNTCWTRGPIEARIRYGVDYKLLTEAGVHNWICEANAAALELEGWNFTKTPKQDDYRSTLQRLKAFMPESNILLLHCVKDGLEQYNVLHHAPTLMESDVYALANIFYNNHRVLDGVTVCLADGIRAFEWKMFDELYSKAFGVDAVNLPYPRVVWSDMAHQKEQDAYCYGKAFLNSHLLHAELIAHGAVLPVTVRLDALPSENAGSLVMLHPAFYSDEECKAIFNASGGNVAEIGFDGDNDSFVFRLFVNGVEKSFYRTKMQPIADYPKFCSWLEELPERSPEKDFLLKTAAAINDVFSVMTALQAPEDIRLWGFGTTDGLFHLFIGNIKHTYQTAVFKLKGRWQFSQLLSGGLVLPPSMQEIDGDTKIAVKLPPWGTVSMTLQQLQA